MKQFKHILNQILFPSLAVVIISVPVATAFLIYAFLYEEDYSPVANISYVFSAYSLIIVCARIIRMPKRSFKTAPFPFIWTATRILVGVMTQTLTQPTIPISQHFV